MKQTEFFYNAEKNLQLLYPGGAFFTAGHGDNANTLTIGWGNLGICWSKPTFIALIAPSRYTHGLVEEYGEFTVTFPYEDMKEALQYVGTKSGRNENKYLGAHITTEAGVVIETPHIACTGMHYECKVVHTNETDPNRLLPEIANKRYPQQNNYHTFYYGEIVAAYLTERTI